MTVTRNSVLSLTALLSTLAIGVSGTVAAASGSSARPGAARHVPSSLLHQKLAWQACFDDGSAPELRCASVTVPEDWSHPDGGTIRIAISRIKAGDPSKRRGVLFSNPGGPGEPGLTLPLFLEAAEPRVAAAYDLIGIDVRGVGSSQALSCAPPRILDALYSLDGRDTSAANQHRFRKLSRKYGQTCAQAALTPFVTDRQTVRDFDLVRALLGATRISYLGYSGGTLLGADYASTFPRRVDRFVFDGNFDYTSRSYDSFARQPHGFQNSFDKFFLPWVATYNRVYGLGDTARKVRRTYERRRAILAKSPITLADGSRLTAAQYDFGVSAGLYWIGSYDPVATAMTTIEHYRAATSDDKQLVADYFGGEPAAGADPFWSITCQLDPSPSYAKIVADTNRFRVHDPLVGASWTAEPCPFFTTGVAGSTVGGGTLPPVLMLNNDNDPATPLDNVRSAHRATPASVLVTIRNEPDHTIYGSGDACADGYANRYLLHGTLPTKDVSCPGLPIPPPAALAAQAGASPSRSTPPRLGVPVREWLERFSRTPTPPMGR